jgi:hypothetical protein
MDCIIDLLRFIWHIFVPFCELLVAAFTGWLAYATVRLAKDTRIASANQIAEHQQSTLKQIGVNCWLEFTRRFDSEDMIKARSKLAKAIKLTPHKPAAYGQSSELVLNFFEDLAIVYQEGFIDKTLANNSFSYYVCRWWEATKDYVEYERKKQGGNNTLFDKFKWLANELKKDHAFPTAAQIPDFIYDESILDSSPTQ